MSKLTVFRVCSTPLGVSEVVSLLKNPLEDGVSTLPPAKSKAGEVYIYRSDKDTDQGINMIQDNAYPVLLAPYM